MKLRALLDEHGARSEPDGLVAAAQAAEAAGFDSVWAGEHVVLPDPQVPPSPWRPRTPPSTRCWPSPGRRPRPHRQARHRHRHPSPAQPGRTGEAAGDARRSVAGASGLRHRGWLPRAGISGHRRQLRGSGAVTDEFLEAMSHLWYDERPAYEGRFVSFSGVDAHPRPVQRAIPSSSAATPRRPTAAPWPAATAGTASR